MNARDTMALAKWSGMRRACLACGQAVFLALLSCVPEQREIPRFRFVAVDVGQGLAQIGAAGSCAVAWDLGLPTAIASWRAAHDAMGRPHLTAIVISHSDWDHCGGLSVLPESLDFSGRVIVHPGEDTAYLREQCAPGWQTRMRFSIVERGDTIGGLPDVRIACLWPSDETGADSLCSSSVLKNRYSLVFRISCGETSLLITSDIDTVAEKALSREYQFAMQSDILMAPHHGSASAVEPVFFCYVRPQAIIISCAVPPNQYGHPSASLMDLVFQMGIAAWPTYEEGTVSLLANGDYWQRE